ncbi:hypothetical protein [Paenibacillus tyrfis]|uniref:hypothetical protein n=1 Tax=Paenibacillus tyrfis TaxID=1501230 RepID=UPI000B591B71|nr:hypothetical protein [Paenibacillus tyrfis]
MSNPGYIGIIGLKITREQRSALKHLTMKIWATWEEAQAYILDHTPASIILSITQAEVFNSCAKVDDPWIVVTDAGNAKEIRHWMAHGASDVWLEGEWLNKLLQKFPRPTASDPNETEQQSSAESNSNVNSSVMLPSTVTIGVSGSDRRTGTTHAAIQLACTLAKESSGKVACVEILKDPEHPLQVFSTLASGEAEDLPGGFRLANIDFYPNVSLEEYIDLMDAGYSYIVVDFGVISDADSDKSHRMEFSRANLKIMTVSGSPWDQYAFLSRHLQMPMIRKQISILMTGSEKRQLDELRWKLNDEGDHVQWILGGWDPQLLAPNIKAYHEILERIMPQETSRRLFRRAR